MRLTTKGRFAVTAMIDLGLRSTNGPVALAAISQRQQISLSYLEQLFGKLRRHELVESTRGPGGGYSLGRDSGEITVWARSEDDEIYLTVDGQVGQPLKRADRVVCRSSEHTLQLVRPPKMLFFDVLRQKLKWGER